MLLVGNGKVITHSSAQPFLENGCVAILGNEIVAVGPTSELRAGYPEAEWIDAEGKVIMPGLINTHMHLYSSFARGMALKSAGPENFLQILERLWWRLDKVLTLEDVRYSALVALIECIKNGTTTIFDHHASPYAVEESLFTLAEAAGQIGVRSSLCYEVSDRDGAEIMEQGMKENLAFIEYANKHYVTKPYPDQSVAESAGQSAPAQDSGMLRGMFGLHAAFTLSDRSLDACREAAAGAGAGFHLHVAEGIEDQNFSEAHYGKRVVQRLSDFGILGPQTIAAHCVHVDSEEINILKESGTQVIHNPESNMGNAVGCAPVLEMMKQGVGIGLGTDGYTTDMFESYKVGNILHKHQLGSPDAAWAELPAMLFANNPRIAQTHFGKPLGILTPGAYADLIILDYDPPTPMHEGNLSGHVLFGMTGRAVETVIVNGKPVMKKRQLLGIDEARIQAKARELAQHVWQRF